MLDDAALDRVLGLGSPRRARDGSGHRSGSPALSRRSITPRPSELSCCASSLGRHGSSVSRTKRPWSSVWSRRWRRSRIACCRAGSSSRHRDPLRSHDLKPRRADRDCWSAKPWRGAGHRERGAHRRGRGCGRAGPCAPHDDAAPERPRSLRPAPNRATPAGGGRAFRSVRGTSTWRRS